MKNTTCEPLVFIWDIFQTTDTSCLPSHLLILFIFRYLPNHRHIVDNYFHKAFCGTYSKEGNIFLTAAQGLWKIWLLLLLIKPDSCFILVHLTCRVITLCVIISNYYIFKYVKLPNQIKPWTSLDGHLRKSFFYSDQNVI